MISPADMELLHEYADSGSEEAFSSLVARHINLVYSVALRRLGKPDQAQEICQAVFIILAKKAGSLPKNTVLSGWLYETARLTAANYLRGEIRRSHREQEAQMQSSLEQSESRAWAQVAPMLEEAMAHLNEQDRNAVVLRFFNSKTFQQVGASLGTSEDAAKMRVNRAVEKLRKFFLRRGVALSSVALCGAVAAHSVEAAPAGVAAAVSAVALKGAAAGTSTLTVIKTTLKVMAWTKAKTAITVAAGVLLVAGTATVSVEQVIEHQSYPWQVENLNTGLLDRLPPQVHIVPSKFRRSAGWVSRQDKVIGLSAPLETILLMAYGENSSSRMVSTATLPDGKYDFISNFPQNSHEALQQELKRKFGLTASHQPRETDVLRLTVKKAGADGLRPGTSQGGSTESGAGRFSCVNQPLSSLISTLENHLALPIVDETGLTGAFDIDLTWDQTDSLEAIHQALLEELGLELTPARKSIDMLVVQQSR